MESSGYAPQMPLLCLHGPLRRLAGGSGEIELDGATVLELLRELERVSPDARGWILDERGMIRRHLNVYVGGEPGRESTAVAADARVQILPAITGG